MPTEGAAPARQSPAGQETPTASSRPSEADLHIVTCEYPPQIGGVADFTRTIAEAAARSGRTVHVWCPGNDLKAQRLNEVVVHRAMGKFSREDFARIDERLNACKGPRVLFLQWVPHGYGYRAMNIALCLWVRRRSRVVGDNVDVMVHEPFLSFRGTSIRTRCVALVHRAMIMIVLRSARRAWVSTTSWIPLLQPFTTSGTEFRWLPVPSGIPVSRDTEAVATLRQRFVSDAEVLIGHFGTYGLPIATQLASILSALFLVRPGVHVLLLGRGGEIMREQILQAHPSLSRQLHATGTQSADEVSHSLQACDVLVQPYPDGISTRRTSAMAALAHGRALVSTRGPLTERYWLDSAALTLVDADDTDAFVARTCELVDDGPRRQELSRAAKSEYAARFAEERALAALLGSESVTR